MEGNISVKILENSVEKPVEVDVLDVYMESIRKNGVCLSVSHI
jgi:hypothetical protein